MAQGWDFHIFEPGIGLIPNAPDFEDRLSDLLGQGSHQGRAPPTPPIEKFVKTLLAVHPDQTYEPDCITVWFDGPMIEAANGPFITVSINGRDEMETRDPVIETALALGLDVFDTEWSWFFSAVDGSKTKVD